MATRNRTPRSAGASAQVASASAATRGAQPGPGISELFSAGPLGGYRAPGPVALSFLQSDAFVCAIRGPLGSGKSTACAVKLFSNVQKQQRLSDGWIRRRTAVIRNTYPELKTTTIKTWQQWFSPSIGRWRETNPPSHHIVDNAAMIDWEVIFIALDRPDDVRKLLSMEISDAWINEAREVPRAILDGLTGRVGRYPRREEGGCTDPQIIMDTNPPDTDHWWYRMAEEANARGGKHGEISEEAEQNAQLEAELRRIGALRPTQKLSEWFAQPGGESPLAENITNLPPGYYLKARANKSSEWVKVYVNGDYGYVLDGRPVYPDYRDHVHCREFELNPRLPIDIGLDFGLTPAAVFAQQMPNGQWRKHSEIVTENMGIVRFAELLKNHIALVYPQIPIRSITGDPAGDIRNDDERTTYDLLKAAGIEARAAHSNEPTLRVEAVSAAMRRMIDGEPGVLVHPRCRTLRKAYAGAYHYKRMALAGEARFRDVPEKNSHSHVADADQYLMLGAGEGKALVRREQRGPRQQYALTDYAIFGDD
ncbi:MAG: TerL [Betaproteobacteria bacterium]|nr:TerL [Betaproteobacteria bacterium]